MSYRTTTRTPGAVLSLAKKEGWSIQVVGPDSFWTYTLTKGREIVDLRFVNDRLTMVTQFKAGVMFSPRRNKAEELVGILIGW